MREERWHVVPARRGDAGRLKAREDGVGIERADHRRNLLVQRVTVPDAVRV